MHSLMTLFWTFLIISILIYMFSILGLELLRPDPEAGDWYNEIIEANFRDFASTILTLLQGLTLDSIGTIYRPIIEAKPLLFFYFIPFIFLVSIALMNLVTAVMVESSLDRAREDKEAMKLWEKTQRKKLVKRLERMFRGLDRDGSGLLELHELLAAEGEIRNELMKFSNCRENMTELQYVFEALDYNGSGKLDITEFVDGVLKSQDGKPMELFCIMRQCNAILKRIGDLPPKCEAGRRRSF